MSAATKDLQTLQGILDDQKSMTEEVEELRQQNAELIEQMKAKTEDMKELEQFRPLLQAVPLQFYKIQLRDSPTMKQLLGLMSQVWGPRFDKELKDIHDFDAEDTKDQTKFVRQCLDSAALACIRYCVMQKSRWNDMVAHYLS